MSQATEDRKTGRPSPEELGLLLARAERGDQGVMDEVATRDPRVLDTRPEDYVDFRFVDRLAATRR